MKISTMWIQRMTVVVAVLAIATIAWGASHAGAPPADAAPAAQDGQPAQPQQPKAVHYKFVRVCKADLAKYCATAKGGSPSPTGDETLAVCLGEHKDALAARCLRAVRRAKRVSVFRQRCGDDVKRLCAEIQPGDGRILRCLRAGDTSLSTACRDHLARLARPARAAGAAGSAGAADVTDAKSVADEAITEESQGVPVLPDAVAPEESATDKSEEPATPPNR
jgi:hypothetical protein